MVLRLALDEEEAGILQFICAQRGLAPDDAVAIALEDTEMLAQLAQCAEAHLWKAMNAASREEKDEERDGAPEADAPSEEKGADAPEAEAGDADARIRETYFLLQRAIGFSDALDALLEVEDARVDDK